MIVNNVYVVCVAVGNTTVPFLCYSTTRETQTNNACIRARWLIVHVPRRWQGEKKNSVQSTIVNGVYGVCMAAGKTAVPFPCFSSTRARVPNHWTIRQRHWQCTCADPGKPMIVPVLTRWQGKRTIPVQPNDRKWCTWSLCDHEDNQISVSLIGPGCREDSSARCRCPKPTTPAKPVPGKMADRALLTRWYGDRKIPVQMIVDEWSDSSVKGHCYFSKGGPDLPIRLLVRGTATFLFRKIHEHCTAITRLIFNIFPSELRIELILNICNEWQSARTQLFVFPDQR